MIDIFGRLHWCENLEFRSALKRISSYRTIVQLIAATTTDAGLKVRAELDENKYPKGVKISDSQLAAVNLSPHAFHADWNYTISPNPKPSSSRKQN
jgi:hypothetical protein